MTSLRRQPHDVALLYLFSYDAELRPGPLEIDTPSGRLLSMFVDATRSVVYSVNGDATVPGFGFRALTGRMEWGNDQLVIGADDVARTDIRATIVTDDRARIDLRYTVVGYLGAGGSRRLLEARDDDQFGNEDCPFEAPFTTSPRFETASPRYRWLNEHQGIGFGTFQIVRNEFRRVTCDVYVLT